VAFGSVTPPLALVPGCVVRTVIEGRTVKREETGIDMPRGVYERKPRLGKTKVEAALGGGEAAAPERKPRAAKAAHPTARKSAYGEVLAMLRKERAALDSAIAALEALGA
jgi:hypothetical protein